MGLLPDADWREELLRDECNDWLLREDGREGEELRDDCSEGLLSDECREAELRELEKEWLLRDAWMLGLLSDDWREGLLGELCRDDRSPEGGEEEAIRAARLSCPPAQGRAGLMTQSLVQGLQ